MMIRWDEMVSIYPGVSQIYIPHLLVHFSYFCITVHHHPSFHLHYPCIPICSPLASLCQAEWWWSWEMDFPSPTDNTAGLKCKSIPSIILGTSMPDKGHGAWYIQSSEYYNIHQYLISRWKICWWNFELGYCSPRSIVSFNFCWLTFKDELLCPSAYNGGFTETGVYNSLRHYLTSWIMPDRYLKYWVPIYTDILALIVWKTSEESKLSMAFQHQMNGETESITPCLE